RLEIQIPLRSGWPSEARGAGALRLGLPSLVRGVPGKGRLIHWACAVKARPRARKRLVTRFESFMTPSFACSIGRTAVFFGLLTLSETGVNRDRTSHLQGVFR